MTVTMPQLSDALQAIVDARLDTIDRMLVGRVARADRLAIVRDVESQIHDILALRDPGDLDREDVLAALARLDPPEAFLPDEATGAVPSPVVRPTNPAPIRTRPVGVESEVKVGRASGILGLCSLGIFGFALVLTMASVTYNSETMLYIFGFGGCLMSLIAASLAIVLAAYVRFRGAWPVVGLVTGIIGAITALGGFVMLVLA